MAELEPQPHLISYAPFLTNKTKKRVGAAAAARVHVSRPAVRLAADWLPTIVEYPPALNNVLYRGKDKDKEAHGAQAPAMQLSLRLSAVTDLETNNKHAKLIVNKRLSGFRLIEFYEPLLKN